jgi:hypothetical protein
MNEMLPLGTTKKHTTHKGEKMLGKKQHDQQTNLGKNAHNIYKTSIND